MYRIIYIALLILFACTNTGTNYFSNNEYQITDIEKELTGELLDDTVTYTKKLINSNLHKTKIFYKVKNKVVKEINVHIVSKQDSTFPIITNYYNKRFSTNKNDSVFNSWQTDSSEFNLYKNSDSSILVNIFKRTYL